MRRLDSCAEDSARYSTCAEPGSQRMWGRWMFSFQTYETRATPASGLFRLSPHRRGED